LLKETIKENNGQIKMIELNLSQGAKPGHGGTLYLAKISREIVEARKLSYPPKSDCHSPPRQSAFNNPWELVEFIAKLRELSGGIPVGVKLLCRRTRGHSSPAVMAMVETGNGPEFITVDGGEGGTGATASIGRGADITCATRAFMMSMGCIQALTQCKQMPNWYSNSK
jgi:glutamate synthase domain-containing protein 2